MGGYQKAAVVALAAFWLCGCDTTSGIDLARNPIIYRTPGYAAPRTVSAEVYIQQLRDVREKVPTFTEAGFHRTVFADTIWERPVPVMVEELLIDEIDRSGIYSGLSQEKLADSDVVIEPSLVAMYRYREAAIGGDMVGRRRTVAYTALRIIVKSPVDARGRREIRLDQVFHNQARTKLSLARAEEGIALTGHTLRAIMAEVLPKLYEANIAKVPAEAVTAPVPPTKR